MDGIHKLKLILSQHEPPPCAALTPFEIIEVNFETGFVKLKFEKQPAFRNHFGNIQGGFAVAMIDVLISISTFVKTGLWLPTVEIKSSFIAPARIGDCVGEGRIIRAGKNLVFSEAVLRGSDNQTVVHATATILVREV
ncbi:MAG: PaaI family thioesterase [Bacteroidota bacterium]